MSKIALVDDDRNILKIPSGLGLLFQIKYKR